MDRSLNSSSILNGIYYLLRSYISFMRNPIIIVLYLCIYILPLQASNMSFSIKISYREVANLFTIMDQVSGWKKEFCKEIYGQIWKEMYPLRKQDSIFFKRYKELREKYFFNPDRSTKALNESASGLFYADTSLTEDPIGYVFYQAKTLEEAFIRLSSIIEPSEIEFLQDFYSYFRDRYMPILEESKKLNILAESLASQIKDERLVSFLGKVAHFYQSTLGENFTVLYVWYPKISSGTAFASGPYAFIQCHPDISPEKALGIDIVIHEIVHMISARQSLASKQKLTSTFINIFKEAESMDKYKILEEPLAVVWGQAMYLKLFNPEAFLKQNYKMNWYYRSWVNVYAQLLIPLLEEAYQKEEIMDEDFIRLVACIARELYFISVNIDYQK